jgi:hypothetical protein
MIVTSPVSNLPAGLERHLLGSLMNLAIITGRQGIPRALSARALKKAPGTTRAVMALAASAKKVSDKSSIHDSVV